MGCDYQRPYFTIYLLKATRQSPRTETSIFAFQGISVSSPNSPFVFVLIVIHQFNQSIVHIETRWAFPCNHELCFVCFFVMPTTCSIECLKDDLFSFGQLVVVVLTLHKINMFEILVCGVGYCCAIKWVET